MIDTDKREYKSFKELSLIELHLKKTDLRGPDPYDVWNTKLGQNVKKIYYKSKILGLIPATFLTLFDYYLNNNKRFGYVAREYPIVRAFQVLICLELYNKEHKEEYISLAAKSLDWLSKNYSKNYSGYCWGINMPWVSKIAVYDETIPHVTHTPYVLEAFLGFQQEVKNVKYVKYVKYDGIINSILSFLEKDLNKMIDNDHELALSYSPVDETRIVINANSYAMFCFALFYKKDPIKNKSLKEKAQRLYNFLINNQKKDGSWYYYADEKAGNFIDCFHSCFVLKNIYKVSKIIPLKNSEKSIQRGYDYLKTHFQSLPKGLFRRFSITDRPSLIKYDLYDNSEMLNLAILLDDKPLIKTLSQAIRENFIVGEDIYSNIIFPNKKINKNMLRWADYPYLYAISKVYRKKD